MLLYVDKTFSHEDLVKETIKKEKVRVFKPEDFENYKKEIEENSENKVEVVFHTVLHEINSDNKEEDKDYLIIEDHCFELVKPRKAKIQYYIPVGEYEFIAVEKKLPLLIILLLLAGVIAVGASFCVLNPDTPLNPLQMDQSQEDGTGDPIQTPDSEAYQESTVVPGYADIQATSTASLVPLSNPESNTVNFVYTILLKESSEVVKSFDDASQAQEYVVSNTKEYENYKDGNSFALKDENGDITSTFIEYKAEDSGSSVDVIKNTYKLVYFSDGIAPGNHIDWNCYEYLGTGDFDVQFRISTYDVETSAQCYGAIQPVHISIH